MRNSSTNTDSNRVTITKKAIFQALYDLMEERDLAKISVGDILERSGVSRATFYRCFDDKYDVINWSFERFKEINPRYKDQYYSFETSFRVQLEYLSDHRDYFARAMRYIGQNSLRDAMFDVNQSYMLQCWHEANGPQDPDFRIKALAEYCAAGMSKVVERWVLDGCAESIDEVVAYVQEFTPSELMELLY